jgi:hypothetical protein
VDFSSEIFRIYSGDAAHDFPDYQVCGNYTLFLSIRYLKNDFMKIHISVRRFSYIILLLASIAITSCVGTRITRQKKVDLVVNRARSYIGTPYKYGGSTVLGMDCSGLLMRSFEVIDIYIPRTSAEQSKLGSKVTIDELKPGDLVFFKTLKKQGKVTHAGLVTDSRKRDQIMFIHSSSSKGVIEANLLSDYYRSTFVKARRLKF